MNAIDGTKGNIMSVREQAEKILKKNTALDSDLTNKDLKSLVYDLQLHQIELEIQNEELRLTQLELADARDRYVELYEYAPVAYLTLDETGKVHEANLKAEKILSKPRAHIIGQSFTRFVSASSQDDYYLHRLAVLSTYNKQVTELTLKGDDDSKIVRVKSMAVISNNMKCSSINMVLVDISAEKRAEESLKNLNRELEEQVGQRTQEIKKNRDLLYTILSTATDAIITINEYGIIENINSATENMFGYAPSELIGENVSLIMPEPYRSQHDLYIARYLTTGEPHIIGSPRELVAMRKDGTHFHISLSVNRMENMQGFTGIIRDVSERINLEKEVLRCVEDERSRISRDIHDSIGQSITGTSMKARSIANRLEKEGDQQGLIFKELSKDLESIAHDIRLIVFDLALFDLEHSSLLDLLKGMVCNYNELGEADVSLECSEKIVINDNMLAMQLLRITQEALINAMKYSNATAIVVRFYQNTENIELSIIDNGTGLDNQTYSSSYPSIEGGYGFGNMRYRAHVIGASLEIVSNIKNGTRIHCRVRV